MKKSIKYAGIAAATLLAVAPVAATSVQATETTETGTTETGTTDTDTTDTDTTETDVKSPDQQTINKALKNFENIYSDSDAGDYDAATIGSLKKNVSTQNYAENFLTANAGLAAGEKTLSADDTATLTAAGFKAYVTADYVTPVNGVTRISDTAELTNALATDSLPNVQFTVHYTYVNPDKTNGSNFVADSSFSFLATKDADDELSTVNATFTTPLKVALNTSVYSTQLQSGADIKVVDQNGDSVALDSKSVDPNYYYTYTGAMTANDDSKIATGSDEINSDNEFAKAGTYYQRISVVANADSALNDFITAYNTNPSKYSIYVNGAKASANDKFTIDTESHTITFVRAIDVSSDTSNWTVTENKGVVTTKSDTPYYTLVNDNNEKISNRALAKNSAWITDQKRVDQNGNTQYRVATGEWIDANNVTFSDKATTDEGAYTDEQALNGKVTLDGPSSFVYFLYNNNGEQIANRALTGDSAWFTDKKATNAAGVTVYHVATGEWVQAGNGVNYSAY
ncbi:hypothetical protein [Companilactobacillus farciminis]|uniref:hypothetical protein n=1 Tax=Companilactobacillus farciminis TaxID=1612 RepID=UPI002330AD36|nr:hypothetical protein [Companilactobacillus farciminis]WCG35933.1 hypothetical protein PML84_01770 [Companilactobacillus farciminis]